MLDLKNKSCSTSRSEGIFSQVSKVAGALSPVNHKGFISGLRETFTQRYIVGRTSKAEIRPEEQSEKAKSCRENSWNEIQLKGP